MKILLVQLLKFFNYHFFIFKINKSEDNLKKNVAYCLRLFKTL